MKRSRDVVDTGVGGSPERKKSGIRTLLFFLPMENREREIVDIRTFSVVSLAKEMTLWLIGVNTSSWEF